MVEKNKIYAISLLILFVVLMVVFDPFWVAFFLLISVLIFAVVLAVMTLGWKKFLKILGSVFVEMYYDFVAGIKNFFSKKGKVEKVKKVDDRKNQEKIAKEKKAKRRASLKK